MKKRKYFTELALNVVAEEKQIIPVEHLKHIEDREGYHVYAILALSKIRFGTFTCEIEHIQFTFFCMEKDKKVDFNIKIQLHKELDHNKVSVNSIFPYDNLNIKIKDDVFLSTHECEKEFDISSEELFLWYSKNQVDALKFEVRYVGQSQGHQGSRNAFDRLESHETLQKILAEENTKDRRVWICLFKFTPRLITSHDGITKNYMTSDIEDQNHMKNVLSDLPIYDQVINITEAAIINYFKPFYNTNFVDNFPSIKHKGYRQYFDLDYNQLIVEPGLIFDKLPPIVFYTDTNKIESEWDYIKYDLFNDENRKSMFYIFK